jgi:hypothetical protein
MRNRCGRCYRYAAFRVLGGRYAGHRLSADYAPSWDYA